MDTGTSVSILYSLLVIQGLSLFAFNAGGMGLISDQRMKILHAHAVRPRTDTVGKRGGHSAELFSTYEEHK